MGVWRAFKLYYYQSTGDFFFEKLRGGGERGGKATMRKAVHTVDAHSRGRAPDATAG